MRRPQHGGNLTWAAKIAGCPTSSIIDFSASINPWGIPPTVVNAITAAIPSLTSYPSPEYADLRQCLGETYGVNADYILPGNGSSELLTWVGKDLAQLQLTYLVVPAFADYYRAMQAFKGKIQVVTGDLPFGSLSSLIPPQSGTNSGLLLNNPHNPTGKLWQKAEIINFLSQFTLVVIDEAFMDFLPPSQQQTLIDLVPDYPNLIILRSLTKFYSLPGLRIGFAVANPKIIAQWQRNRDPWSVNSLAVTAAMTALQDRDFQQHSWQWLVSAKAELDRGLKAISGLQPLPSAANFLLVKSELSVTLLQEKLLQKTQIYIRDCLSFAELGDRYFRIAVRTPSENQLLLQSLQQVMSQYY